MSDLISRQAAIDEIKALYEWHDTVTEDRVIDHLKRLPSVQPEILACGEGELNVPDTNVGDMISRQAAIDAPGEAPKSKLRIVKTYADQWFDDVAKLSSLLSAQAEERTEERTETHACDMISRQVAIDALWKALYEYEDAMEKLFKNSDELDVYDWIIHRVFVQTMNDIDREVIKELPPAQPERKTGRWIPYLPEGLRYKCSECESRYENPWHYCPNCGADMRGDKE